jgi:hypothetical protein
MFYKKGILLKKCMLSSLSVVILITLSGCGSRFHYDPRWKAYSVGTGTEWQVNRDHYVGDSETAFQWTIYTGTKSRTPDFSYWTTQSSWKELTTAQAKQQLGILWRLAPKGHFYFYELSTPSTAWVMMPATMVGVYTSLKGSNDSKRLVKDIIYGSGSDAPIFLTATPLQLTSVTTNQTQQSVTFTWKPLSLSSISYSLISLFSDTMICEG